MISSVIHQPCEVTLHLLSEDIFIHPAAPNSELPGKDQTLRGVVEVRAPSERTIQGLRVQLQGLQTLAIPDAGYSQSSGIRWEERVMMDKVVEIMSDGEGGIVKHHKNRAKGKGREKAAPQSKPPAYGASPGDVTPASLPDLDLATLTAPPASQERTEGLHLAKGVHGFEFSFIIPASSPPFERSKHGRLRYIVTATALGAGRARHNVSTWREIFVILNVDKDGGPIPLEIAYADVHEALGPISISLTAASLTVGGTATLTVVHPDPPPKLNVHVIRAFCEQTVELYSEARKAWLKLPPEKLRIAEWGHMPNKQNKAPPSPLHPPRDPADTIWLADGEAPGHPGRGATQALPHHAPYGTPIGHSSSSAPATPGIGSPQMRGQALPGSSPTSGLDASGTSSAAAFGSQTAPHGRRGYKIKATLRLPNDDHMRPSTVKGSRAELRVSHEMGVEVFFSRLDVLDTRENSETLGKPKVQVFSARRAVTIPSCTATFDTVHLPPYVQESPVSSRPPSPTNLARSPTYHQSNGSHLAANHSHSDLQRLAHTLHNTLPGGRGRPTPPQSKSVSHPASNHSSAPGSRYGSREPSPTRPPIERGHSGQGLGHSISAALGSHFPGRKSRPNSRPSSPTHERADPFAGVSGASPGGVSGGGISSTRGRRGFGHSLQGFTPAVATHTATAPASGTATPVPRTLPPNSPWSVSNRPPRTANSHDTCNCGRTTEELANAEHRLLDGVPTAPGAFSEHHAEGEMPPPWSESRAPSPDYFSEVWASTASAVATPAVLRSKTPHCTP
ncbi:unnamed protein product [Parajaminaea phylloscopi]